MILMKKYIKIIIINIFVVFFINHLFNYTLANDNVINYNKNKINSSKIIEDGIYQIHTLIDPTKVIDITKASKKNGANIEIWNNTKGENQKFQLTYDNEGYYTISDIRTGKVLDVYGGYSKPGTNVQMWEVNGTDGQKWKIDKDGEAYIITSKIGNLVLDVYGGYNTDGTNVQIWNNNKTNGQKWKIDKYYKNGERIIEDGIYQIHTLIDTTKVIDITKASEKNGANIEIWNNTKGENQKFQFTYDNEGYYTISDIRTGKVLDVYGGYSKPGTNVQMWEVNGTDGQKWKIDKDGEAYIITSKIGNLVLDVYGGYNTDGTNVQIWNNNKTNGQKWKIEKSGKKGEKIIDDGIYIIKSIIDSSKVLDVTGASLKNGANIEIWDKTELNNQKFRVTYDNNGYYVISDIRTGKVLDVYGGYSKPGTNVQMWEANGTDGQKWKIEKKEEGYKIVSKLGDLALDIYGGYIKSGTNVQIWTNYGSEGQRFDFEKTNKNVIENGLYEIQTMVDNNKVLDVTGRSIENGANVEIWERTYGNNQKFNVNYVGNGYYTISDVRTGKMLEVCKDKSSPGTNVQMWETNGTDRQKWKIEKNGKGYLIISKIGNLALDLYGGYTASGTNIQVWTNNKSDWQSFIFNATTVEKDKNYDWCNIDSNKYPGYKEKIQKLVKAHPNWDFKLLYTGLTLDQAVKGEYAVHSRNLVPSNYSGEWVCSVCGTRLYDSGWYCASEKAIAYYMDSRNFLDDTNVFQFLDLNAYTSDSVSLSGIQSKVNGSFLQNYANDINKACINTNVNPYYIIARLIQEQGYSGTTIGKGMDGGNGRTYYNPFNIGASGNGYSQIYANALATAKSYGWDSMQKAIEGGISFCKKNWLENYQNTLYQNKFDIDKTNGTSLYTHQYMQNLMGAYSEARTLRDMYSNTGKLDSNFTFIIPVYENAGSNVAQPSHNSESTPINVKVVANGGLNLRSEANSNSNVIKLVPNGEIILSVQRGINSNWQKVVLKDGTVGYMSGTYLQQVGDVTNCNYSAYVKTSDGTGCYVRSGPTTKTDRITALSDGTWLTVINEGTYNNIDGYNWVRVMLSDGRQAFMPSKYLSR